MLGVREQGGCDSKEATEGNVLEDLNSDYGNGYTNPCVYFNSHNCTPKKVNFTVCKCIYKKKVFVKKQ